MSDFPSAIALAEAHSPYLRGLLRRRAATVARLIADGPDAALSVALVGATDAARPVDARLRHAKADVALIAALADLTGAWPLERVTGALSELADVAVDAAIGAALAERDAPNAGFVALALGKLGSFELNYSSDIDLILLYDPVVIPVRAREEHESAAVRIARRVVAILQDVTADGYVFRTDLRLRPVPEATPLALPVAAAEHYYQSEAETWERTAFIRARACGGDIALGRAFLESVAPFVWRRSLDYTAIADIRAVSLRIRDHYDAGQAVGPGYDLKRGRGGIREIEFFAQIHQLVWGGRDLQLRAPATLDALAALADAGRIGAADATLLAEAYRFLRTLEHRLQMRDDAQTHSVPLAAPMRRDIARLAGFADWRAAERRLAQVTAGVALRYDALVADAATPRSDLPVDTPGMARWLDARHLPPAFAANVERWRAAPYRALRNGPARATFEALLPALLAALGAATDPATAASRFDSFLAQLPAGLQFFALLEANPRLLPLFGRLLGVTPVLADALARRPALFDVVLAGDSFAPLPDAPTLTAALRTSVAGAGLEDALDRVRGWTAEHRFQLGAQLIEGADPLRVARDLAAVADAGVAVLADAVADAFAATHGSVPGGRLLVVALGRYGGSALTHASDLDLIYLFTGRFDAVSDGRKPLGATQYFGQLSQRLNAALSVPTAAGALYEVDTRLRPSGAQGLLAVSVDSFAAYQAREAWTWEHMALARARVVRGDAADRAALEAVIAAVIAQPRDAAVLRRDVLAMRADIAAAKPAGGLWDIKLGAGGLVDLEFLVHHRQLRNGRAPTPELGAACVAAGLDALVPAHDLLTRLLVVLRLTVPGAVPAGATLPPAVRSLLTAATGFADFDALTRALAQAKASVQSAWGAEFGRERGDRT